MSRELMQQALEALEFEASGWEDVPPITREAITALRQALSEQPAHQEVDWEKLYRLEFKKKEALAAKYERDIKPLTKIVLMKQPAQQQEPVGDDRVMTVVYRNVQKEDVQSFTDHPKAVWFGWCHAPYQRDDAIFKLEKAITSPPASKPWVGLTDQEVMVAAYQAGFDIHEDYENEDDPEAMHWWTPDGEAGDDSLLKLRDLIEAKLKEKNHG